jgi:hypothetical protein
MLPGENTDTSEKISLLHTVHEIGTTRVFSHCMQHPNNYLWLLYCTFQKYVPCLVSLWCLFHFCTFYTNNYCSLSS